MSILNRPGWANRIIIEGRLHSDELKQRITNLFIRTSLGNSPTYAVSKIADILRREKGDDVDINDIADEDIIRIANDDEVTNGKFQPELKSAIADARQESEDQISSLDDGLPSSQDDSSSDNTEENSDSHSNKYESDDLIETDTQEDSEDSEETKTCEDCEEWNNQRPPDESKLNSIINKENIKLSPKAIDRLLKENYIKSRQHRFKIEERYKNY